MDEFLLDLLIFSLVGWITLVVALVTLDLIDRHRRR